MNTHQERFFTYLIILSSLIYHAIIGLQGFDMADEGWSLTGHQQIFNDPESVEYLFLYYLTHLIGGVWNYLFGWGGIYSFRLLTSIVLTLTSLIIWRLLRPYFNSWSIVVGIWASFFCSYYGIMIFYHNYLSAFLSVCAATTLFKAVKNYDWRWMIISGIILGCNVFARLPNISLITLVFLLIPFYIYNRNINKAIFLLLSGSGGFLIGLVFIILRMLLLGHVHIYMNAINSGLSASSSADSTHNLGTMAITYLNVYKSIFTTGYHNNTHTIYLLCSLGWLWVVCSQRYNREYVYIATIAIIILHTLPIGSDFGINNMGENSLYLAVPILTGFVWKEINTISDIRLHRCGSVIAIILIAFFYIRGAKQILYQCYFDDGPRWKKTYMIDATLATTFTTERKRLLLNSLLHELSKYTKKDDYVLCFQNSPSLHFLTCTRPYLYNPWVWTYDSKNMEYQFQRAEQEHSQLPVIVRDKSIMPQWYKYDPNWNNVFAEETYLHKNKKIKLFNDFVIRHHYNLIWENEVFQILLPQQTQ